MIFRTPRQNCNMIHTIPIMTRSVAKALGQNIQPQYGVRLWLSLPRSKCWGILPNGHDWTGFGYQAN